MGYLKVDSFRETGKWYHTSETEMELNSYEEVFELEHKIKNNDPSVRDYSGLTCGFAEFFFVIEYINDKNLFMNFLMDRTTVKECIPITEAKENIIKMFEKYGSKVAESYLDDVISEIKMAANEVLANDK